MFDQLALTVFSQFIVCGELALRVGDGVPVVLRGAAPGPAASIHVADSRTLWRIVIKPDLAIGEAYMQGRLHIDNDDLEAFMHLLIANSKHWEGHWAGRLSLFISDRFAPLFHLNLLRASKRNVAHHYDLTDALFASFLDPRRQYSCGYFSTADTSLEEAQVTKLARLAAKLNLQPGDRVLDIGCGWGGLAAAMMQCQPDVHVTGITLSERQLVYARNHLGKLAASDRVIPAMRDYRRQTGHFDKIVSVGMLEHVGPGNFGTYFRKVRELLNADGIAVIHSIGVHGRARPVNRWLQKYIFPSGFLPSLDQMVAATEMQGLKILDLEIMRGHYAETLKHWRMNFHANIEDVRNHYDDTFIRMWNFYLLGCEYFFRLQHGMVLQLQLAHNQVAAPANRRYVGDLQDKFRDILCKDSPSGKQSN
ncbi:MAG: class I SAM-dependent methyltransferase [Candidatus Puniceispirillaceae bacterium]